MAASLGLHCHHYHVAAAAANPLRKAAKQVLSSLILKSSKPHHHHSCCYNSDSVGAKEIRSPDLVALEYADLNLSDKISGVRKTFFFYPLTLIYQNMLFKEFLWQELGHVRIRQHVNPLSSSFSVSNLSLFIFMFWL
jgi:tRNA (guanine-N7-)-methyltransferase